jgi:hypothetical protein
MKTQGAIHDAKWTAMGRAFMILLAFVVVLFINLAPFFDGRDDLLDFGSFYASGLKLANGENPYDPDSDYIFEIVFPKVGAGGTMLNLNPPVSLLFFRLLAGTDPERSSKVWQGLSAILYAASVFLLAREYPENVTPLRLIWAFMLAGAWHTIVLGQVYTVLLLLAVLGWIWLRQGKPIHAGIAIGLLVALKPNFAIWILFLIVSGFTLTSAVSLLTALVMSVVPLILYGPNIYTQWLEASALQRETLIMPGNSSLAGLVARFDGVSAGIVIGLLAVLALLILARYRPAVGMEKPEVISALGLLASLLASPIAWTGYTILLLPVFFSLKRWTPPVILSAAILAIPFQLVLLYFQSSFAAFVLLGWLYGWALLILLGALVRKAMMTSSIQTN